MSTDPPVRLRLGLPWWVLVALAALALPRVLLQDLGVSVHPVIEVLLTLGPPVVWVVVAVRRQVPAPVVTLVTVGSLYGAALAVVHNLMWDEVFARRPPQLGGALAGELPARTEEILLRVAMTSSSAFTGMAMGLIAGLAATLVGSRTRGDSRDAA